jgi:ferric-dicitrate binding protein FerR (iron transport regulator)
MTTDPNSLIQGYFDGLLSDEQVRELNDWIKADPRHARQFASFALMHDRLHDQFRSRAALEDDRRRTGRWGRGRRRWSIAAAVLIGVGLAVLAARSARQGPGRDAVASLVEARNVTWAEGQAPIGPGARIAPGAIRCLSGTLKLIFDSGATVALEGPADLRVLSGMRIRAVRGRLTARVDDRAKGFAVETPNTVVVDQGTEFGVEVDTAGRTGVVVFEGLVDLSRPESADGPAPIKRLSQGEALRVDREGGLSRIVAVERRPGDDAWSTGPSADRDAVIRSVRDNIRGLDSPMYYQIVHRGLDDDVLAYVDRPYQWNAVDPAGLPAFLRGADYIMPFNQDKVMTDLQVTVEVARGATLYIFYDDRAKPPAWLTGQFTDTGVDIGLDESPPGIGTSLDRGPGRSIDTIFSVWRCDLGGDGSIQLGAMVPSKLGRRAMYGIAAAPRP